MTDASIEYDVEIDVAQVQQAVQRGTRAISRALHAVAVALRDQHIPDEAPQGATGDLASDWHLTQEDALTWILRPGSRAFYAHMVSGGTVAHGPRTARAMRIGESRFVTWVSGVPANPFDERAKQAADARAEEFLEQALAEQGGL